MGASMILKERMCRCSTYLDRQRDAFTICNTNPHSQRVHILHEAPDDAGGTSDCFRVIEGDTKGLTPKIWVGVPRDCQDLAPEVG
jgi:hypothetical protein